MKNDSNPNLIKNNADDMACGSLPPKIATIQESFNAEFPRTSADLKCRATPIWKRSLDLLIIAMLSPLLLPMMLLIACFIKCFSKGPVFFCQQRLGYGGQFFKIFKFRTLKPEEYCVTSHHRQYVTQLMGSDAAAAKPDIRNRLILGGSFLRLASLDELPQLFNVLRGDMTIVGPRPDVLQWEDYKPWQRRRFEVTPGITGLWQVSGKNRLSFDEMIRLDIQYTEKRSLQLDLWILWKTLAVVFRFSNK